MEKAHGKLEAPCELCPRGKATAFCRQCVNFICDECVKSHKWMKSFAGHVVSTLEELKQGGVKELSVVDTPAQKCPDHDEPLKIFCFDCKQLICRDCVIFDHRDHNSEFVKKAAPETRKKLAEHLSPLKNLLPDLSTAVNQVRATKQEIQAEGKLVEKQVNAKFQELHDILEQCKASVLKKAHDIGERKIEKLTVQEKGLDLSVGCVQSLVDFVERTLENASDEELITMQEQVVSRIDAEVVKRGKEAASADPVEKADFGVEVFVSEDLKKLCENNVVVYEDNVYARGEGTRNAEVGTPSRLTLHFAKDVRKPPTIQASLKSLVDQTSLQLEAVPVKKGVYSIEYIPKVRGRHHLLISVDGRPITGSPFSVFVRIPPTKLDKPVMKIQGVNPWFLTMNSSNEVIVSDCDRDVVVMNKQGERLRSISKTQHQLRSVRGVAVDEDDNIYVTDSGVHCVYKFNKNGELLERVGNRGSGPGEFYFPRGVAVAGDHVFVCDRNNHRVQVLTRELQPVKQFGSQGSGDGQFNYPDGIAVDSEGMLYVSDCNNHRVQVFTRNGQFVYSFGKEGSGQGKLNGPRGVCVDASYVYVADNSNNRVSVFSKDGQFITSCGKGHTTNPHGVFVDSDSFLYVCNTNCIVVY